MTAILTAAGCADVASYNAALLRPRGTAAENQAKLNEAVALIAQLRYEEAAAKLTPLIQTFSDAGDEDRAAEATFWLAYCYEKQGQTEKAARIYRHVIKRYPETSATTQANQRLALMPTHPNP